MMELQINDPEIVTARELATHANDIKHLQADMDKLVQDMEEVKKSLADIQRLLSESAASKKVWHTIFTVGAGLVGGIIVWALDRVWK
jgi:tRNA A37 threonylcarbamoyladenosine dehydratase